MRSSKARGFLIGSAGLMLAAMSGCGGVITFNDETAISVMGTPPPPPPPPPPQPEPRVELRDNKIVIRDKIQFAYNKAEILSESFSLMDEVAKVIKANPHVKKIAIEGHASSEGADEHNLKLSDARAKAVMAYLVAKGGIPDKKLSAKGYGENKPLVNESGLDGPALDQAREKNRRVEFNVVEQDVTQTKVEIDPETGKERVVDKKSLK